MSAAGPSPTIVPVNLGCCTAGPRCLLCAPPPPPPTPEAVRARVSRVRQAQSESDRPLRVGFYGGAPPPDALLDAIEGVPFVARVRPDLLSRAEATRLVERGAVGIELDALSLGDAALKSVGRAYGGRWVLSQLEGIQAMGIRPGVVLSPGLPHTSHADSVADAEAVGPLADFARIHPVLVLRDSGLRRAHMDGTYVPLTLGQAITTCRAMLEVFERHGVEVIRVGQSPGPDGLGRAVAGPIHTSLRQLVDARRVLALLQTRLYGVPAGASVRIRCNPADETHTRGPYNQHLRTLRAAHGLSEVRIHPDPALRRGEFVVQHGEDG